MTSFDLLVFDCDGVLVDSELLSTRAIQSVLVEEGFPVPIEAIDACIGMKQSDILARLNNHFSTGVESSLVDRIWLATRNLFEVELNATSGVHDFLTRVVLPRCVASSSTHERIRFSLEKTGLSGLFPSNAIFSSNDVKHGKPAPDLFLHAANCMSALPQRCVLIEDSPFGVQGGKAAGMSVIGYTGGSHSNDAIGRLLKEKGADWIVNSWSEVEAIVLSEVGH